MNVQAPEAPRQFRLRLGVYPPSQVLQPDWRSSHSATASPRRSSCAQQGPFAPVAFTTFFTTTDPSDARSPSIRLPVLPVVRSTLLRRFPAGASRASPVDSTRPCHRAAAATPPEGTAVARGGRLLLPSPSTERLGLRGSFSRGYSCVHSRCRPVTRSPPLTVALSTGFSSFGYPPSCRPSYRASGFYPGGLSSH